MTQYNLVETEGQQILTVLTESGELVTLTPLTHDTFDDVLDAVRNNESIEHLLSRESAAVERFEALSDRVSIANGVVYFDGDAQDDVLATNIIRALDEDADFMALVNFMEKIATNPSERSRSQLYDWLRAQDASINSNGNVVTYKSVDRDGSGYKSISSGTAYVNGQRQTGRIKQYVGDEVSMPRAEVDNNGDVACSYGLHAGAWSYASTFSGEVVLEVEINPRDFVSVPHDHDHAKARVSKYRVVREIDKPHSEFVSTYDYEDDFEDYDAYVDYYDYKWSY